MLSGKFGEWAGSLKKGAFIKVEGELRYREFQAKGSDAKIGAGEIRTIPEPQASTRGSWISQ